jgi:Enoyl-(Acyl carrier protein) reductase
MKTNLYGYFHMSQETVPPYETRRCHREHRLSHRHHGQQEPAGLFDHQGRHSCLHSLSSHLISRGIWVNAVAPGPVWTPLNPADKQGKDVTGAKTRMKRPAQPEEVAPPTCSSPRLNGPATSPARSFRSLGLRRRVRCGAWPETSPRHQCLPIGEVSTASVRQCQQVRPSLCLALALFGLPRLGHCDCNCLLSALHLPSRPTP